MRSWWVAFLLLIGMSQPVHATPVAGVLRVQPVTNGVKVRLALSGPLADPPTAFPLPEPMRWAIDIPGASSVRRDIDGAGLARAARVSQFDPQTVRIVIDLSEPMEIVAVRQDRDNALEVELRRTDAAAFAALVKRGRRQAPGFTQVNFVAVPPGPRPAPDLADESAARLNAVEAALATAEKQVSAGSPPSPPTTASPAKASSTAASTATASPARKPAVVVRTRGKARPLVVIDAGHGGKDPGAPSVRGGNEKDVTLAIARAVKRAIQKKGGVDVKLTRDDDTFVTLGGRVRLARQWGADLFISIHADSAANSDARGASVYTLSDVASDREAARLASKENRADLIANVDLTKENREVTSLLIDLAQRDSMNASADFAEELQRALMPKGVTFRTGFHRFAGFAVLKNLGTPAVLLETGYLSNPNDSDFLMSGKGQRAVAEGIAEAAHRFLKGD